MSTMPSFSMNRKILYNALNFSALTGEKLLRINGFKVQAYLNHFPIVRLPIILCYTSTH